MDSREKKHESQEEDLPSQPQTPPSRLTEVTPSQNLLQVHRNQEAEAKDVVVTPSKQRRCSCKASRCLKLYCECFVAVSYCNNGCNCLNCHNNLAYETTSRQEAIKAILECNPDAFKPKISSSSPHGINDFQEDVRQRQILGKHNRGCHCKRSGCLRKYCECYQANIRCSENCRCRDCNNFEGISQEIMQQTRINAAVNMSIKRKRKAASSHSVAARDSSAVPHLVQNNHTVDYVVRNGDTCLLTVPNNQAVPGSTTSTYRSSLSNTIQLGHVKELCSLLVSKSVQVAH
ncbi:unnamed protein product [Eruca vesicaria subsp. sativa]|uniref:CRC domain-containing protein n=1 Tax=Eruca vesicaria subsp. sativa TaxID=29727 RepID=A0ABC8KIG8_ERUVS|nr:unnamed protein product [Eruca vesicaria subsp. sativa]